MARHILTSLVLGAGTDAGLDDGLLEAYDVKTTPGLRALFLRTSTKARHLLAKDVLWRTSTKARHLLAKYVL